MPTKKPRLIVTLEPRLYAKVKAISKSNGTTLSLAARDLIREACEDIEDLGLVAMARERLKATVKGPWLKHDQAWK
ncbi:MAG: antitoxin, RHH family protein [Elusimicrobia bacterium]|nr:antitoxin, RHH family protein [Elusimicrobiota bacterium]